MTILRHRLGFSLAVAVIAAAIADPIVEFAANTGRFGAGTFTDRSNLDVVPAFVFGLALLALHFVRRSRAILDVRVPTGGVGAVLPAIFAMQIAALYGMETLEQIVVWGHTFAPGIWLGGPLALSLSIHAAVCCAVALVIARSRRRLAATTLRMIRLVRAIVTRALAAEQPPARRRFEFVWFKEFQPVLCAPGERAPPH